MAVRKRALPLQYLVLQLKFFADDDDDDYTMAWKIGTLEGNDNATSQATASAYAW